MFYEEMAMRLPKCYFGVFKSFIRWGKKYTYLHLKHSQSSPLINVSIMKTSLALTG